MFLRPHFATSSPALDQVKWFWGDVGILSPGEVISYLLWNAQLRLRPSIAHLSHPIATSTPLWNDPLGFAVKDAKNTVLCPSLWESWRSLYFQVTNGLMSEKSGYMLSNGKMRKNYFGSHHPPVSSATVISPGLITLKKPFTADI